MNEGASAAAVRHHYDVGNDFFRLWLDRDLTYSCALYGRDDDTLEEAQRRKIEYHIAQSRADGADAVLDIGCGWGTLLRACVDDHGVRRAVGLTLSEEQVRWIRDLGDPRIEARAESWATHRPETPYDAIVSVGAFEHFGRRGASDDERVAIYRNFFACCRAMIRDGGRMSLQTIAYGTMRRSEFSPFIGSAILVESDLPLLSEIIAASEGLFEIMQLRNDREHYGRTCREWFRRLQAHRETAVGLVGEERVAEFERFLRMSAAGFERGKLMLLRLTFAAIGPS